MSHPDPLITFFRLQPTAPDHVLLQIAANADDAAVLDARNRRLDVIEAHPLAATPDADEARLAVHAAAARLLQTPAQLRQGSAAAHPKASIDLPRPIPRLGHTRTIASLDREALLLIGLEGGWSPRVLTRLAGLAVLRGLRTSDAVASVKRLAKPSGGIPTAKRKSKHVQHTNAPKPQRRPDANASGPAQSSSEHPADEEIVQVWMSNLLAIGTTAGLTLAILILTGLWAISLLNESGTKQDAQDSVSQPGLLSNGDPNRIAPPREAVENPELVLYELNAASNLIRNQQHDEAVFRVRAALDHWLTAWPTDSPDAFSEILAKIPALLEQLASDRSADTLLAAYLEALLNTSATSPTRAIATETPYTIPSQAIPVRIALLAAHAEAALPQTSAIDRALGQAWQAFLGDEEPADAGTAAWLTTRHLAYANFTKPDEAFEIWATSAKTLAASLQRDDNPLLLEAAAALLRRPTPPSPADQAAIASMTQTLDWRSGSDARMWLLARLRDRTVHPDRIATAMQTLATTSAAPGIATTATLENGAGLPSRLELADSLASTWSLEVAQTPDLLAREWLLEADRQFAQSHPTASVDLAEHVATLFHLNVAGLLLLDDRDDAALSALTALQRPRTQDLQRRPLFGAPRSSGFAESVADPEDDRTLDLLRELRAQANAISPADAAALVYLAFSSRDLTLREAAASTLRSLGPNPAVLRATLDELPGLPQTADARDLLASMVSEPIEPFSAESATQAAHRTLAAALLERSDALAPRFDAASDNLTRAMRHLTGPGSHLDAASPAESLAAHNTLRLARLRSGADPSSQHHLDALHQDHRAQAQLARGGIQRFAAEQNFTLSLSAQQLSRAFPELHAPIRDLLEDLQRRTNNSDRVLVQTYLTARTHATMLSFAIDAVAQADAAPRSPAANGLEPGETLLPGVQTVPPSTSSSAESDLALPIEQRLTLVSSPPPAVWLALGEELIAAARPRDAIQPLALALYYAQQSQNAQVLASAAMALTQLSDDAAIQSMLRALAEMARPELALPNWSDQRTTQGASHPARAQAAQALLDLRRGRGDLTITALQSPELAQLLQAQPELQALAPRSNAVPAWLRTLAAGWPCPECRNRRTVRNRNQSRTVCRECRGDPGPLLEEDALLALLTVEVRLLTPNELWSTARVTPEQLLPIQQPSVERILQHFSVDPTATRFRDGRWLRP